MSTHYALGGFCTKRGSSHRSTLVLLAAGLAGIAAVPSTFAGSVITSNLPSNTAIVNVDATKDGAATYSGPGQSLWYQPFSTLGSTHLLELTVPAGVYGFRVIDPTDAAQAFPLLTPAQLSEMFTAWTYNSPWVTDYLVFDGAAASDNSRYQLFDGAFSNIDGTPWKTYADAATAYAAAITNDFFNLIRPGPLGRAETNSATTYTFTEATTLIFVVPDYYLGDNSGGVSVLVSPAAVQPSLAIQSSPGTVSLLWETNAAGFVLETETTLTPPSWEAVTNTVGVAGTNFLVTLPVDSATRFFRLHHS